MLSEEGDQITQQTPLLRDQPQGRAQKSALPPVRHKQKALFLIFFYTAIANFCGSTFAYPVFRLTQHAVCYETVKRRGDFANLPADYDAAICSETDIQVKLAKIIAYGNLFNTLPTLLTSMFFSRLADTWGRKPILGMAVAGIILNYYWLPFLNYMVVELGWNIDTRWIWAAGLARIIGGGDAVVIGTLHAMLADILDPAERFSYFSIFSALMYVPDMIAPPFGAWLSDQWKYLPYYVGILFIVIIFSSLAGIPETLRRRDAQLTANEADPDEDASTKVLTTSNEFYQLIFTSRIWTLLVVLLVVHFATVLSDVPFKQFSVRVIGWSLQSSSFMTSAMAAVSFALSALLFPAIHRWLSTKTAKDLVECEITIATISLSLFAISGAIRGLLIEPTWFIIGSLLFPTAMATLPALKSLGAAVFPENMQSQFYAMTGIIHTVGVISADPASAALLSRGLILGGQWRGLPFDISAIGAALAMLILLATYKGWVLVSSRTKYTEV